MKKWCRLVCCLLAAALLLTGCGSKDISFVWRSTAQIKTLDPQLASSAVELSAVRQMFSGLYRINEAGDAVADQALTTEISSDGLTYTFTLSPDAVYTDAKDHTTPVTAADYVFALQRAVSPSTHSPYANNFMMIAGARDVYENGADPSALAVRAVNDTTLQITLTAPDSGFPARLASCAAMPCNQAFFESTGGSYGLTKATILGNGVFVLSGWSESAGLTLLRIRGGTAGSITRVRFVPDDASASAADLMSDGKQDLAVAQPGDESDTLAARGFAGQQFETGTAALLFNCTDPALANLSLRTALADWAVESAAGFTAGSSLSDAAGLVPGAVTVGSVSYRDAAGDVRLRYAASQRYAMYQLGLGEAGISKLSGITVLIPDSEPYISLYRAVNQNWQRELGAFFSVEQVDDATLQKRLAKGDYDIALVPLSFTENSPSAALSAYVTGSTSNVTGFTNAEYDTLYQTAMTTSGSGQIEAFAQAERLLLANAPVVPLKFINQTIFTAAGLSGLVIDPFGPVLDLTGAVVKR